MMSNKDELGLFVFPRDEGILHQQREYQDSGWYIVERLNGGNDQPNFDLFEINQSSDKDIPCGSFYTLTCAYNIALMLT